MPLPQTPAPAELKQLGILFNTGRYIELENQANSLLGVYPGSGLIWELLGLSLQKQGKNSLQAFEKTVELMPDDARAHDNLGTALQDSGKLHDAMACHRQAIKLKPDYADAHFNLGNVMQKLGQMDDAANSYRRALEIKPDFADAHGKLSIVLKELGQLEASMASHRRALQLKHNFAESFNSQGVAFLERGQLDGAIASFHRALEFKPDFARAHNNLGLALLECGQFDGAAASFDRALQLNPDSSKACNNLGNALAGLRRFDDAVASYRSALSINPNFAEAHSNLLLCLNYSETVDAQTLFAEHCRFAEQFEVPLRDHWPQHANSPDSERCLQIGFVSADLRNHPVANYIEPVLAHLSRCPQLALHAYYNHTIQDAVTQRLQEHFMHWHSIAGLSDDVVSQKIRGDGIDILIDLSGHTGHNRLLTFARKPAPIQISWIGYAGTTGLSAMDYYLADRFFLPPGRFDGQFTEKIVHLPAIAPFLPHKDAPPVNALPALSNGYLTFGSFNRTSKLSPSVISMWSQLLRALPGSRMLLGAMSEGDHSTIIEWFAKEGIGRERFDLHMRSNMEHYLSLHHQVDICLDTFPYNGATTTCHALWMGVPTLTVTGNTPTSRGGAALLGHVELERFVAVDAADFVQKGVSLAQNIAELSNIRTGLRERFAISAMGQPAVVAAGIERTLRVMWQGWCAGLSPVAIDASAYR